MQDPELMRKKALYFVVLTFIFSYLLAVVYYLMGGRIQDEGFVYMAVGYMFIPMIVAMVLQKFVYKDSLTDLGLSFKFNWWWLVAWILPLILALLTFAVSLLIPGVQYSPGMEGFLERLSGSVTPEQLEMLKTQITSFPLIIFVSMVIQGLIFGATLNAVAAFGEEYGWRGFLQKQYSYMSFWKMSLLIGVIWGLWHVPIIIQGYNYPQHPVLGVAMMTIFTVLFTPLIAYIRIRSGSVIAAAIMHGTLNATAGLSFIFTTGGSDLTVGVMGLAGFIALIMLNLIMIVYDQKVAKEPIM